jgi:hypothetical protein
MTDDHQPAAEVRPDRWDWLKLAWTSVYGIVKSTLTGPDGVSWAPGRIMGFGVFAVGQCLVVRAAQSVLAKGLSAAEWTTFFNGVAGFEALDCATAIGLVLGMAPTDPGGKWWGREASPPPPPNRQP